jgi:hypothetical protein
MKRLGICQKCGEEKMVRDHHSKGYSKENEDITVPYCLSCDMKAHFKARREGRCKLDTKISKKLSRNSCMRKSYKKKMLSSKTISPNIRLFEQIQININTGEINIGSHFSGNHGYKIKYIEVE